MKRFEILVGGTVIGTYETKEQAEKALYEVKHSFYALVHPIDCIFIKEVIK